MARYFVRNLRGPTFAAYYLTCNNMALYYRELLLLGGWSEITNSDGGVPGGAWASTLLVNELGGVSGFSVAAANPTRIYSSAGVFTAAMQTNECAIFLKASTTQNRVAGRIIRYIDANNVEIDPDSAPPNGWINEGGFGTYVPGRISSPKTATLIPTAWVLLQAPSGNNRALLTYQSSSIFRLQVQPKGGAADATTIPAAGIDIGSYANYKVVFNAVLEDPNALIYSFGDYTNTYNYFTLFGELDQAAAGDSDPGFIQGSGTFAAVNAWMYPMYMLSGNPVSTQITAYPTVVKWYPNQNVNTGGPFFSKQWILQNGSPGKAALRTPLVVLDNVVNFGACLRGSMPLIRYADINFEVWRPIDAAGNWINLASGLVVPRNGPNDPRIAIPYV